MPLPNMALLKQMKLYVQYGEDASNQWIRLCDMELKSSMAVHSSTVTPHGLLELPIEEIMLPNDEQLKISVTYSMENRGVRIRVMSGDTVLLHVGGFKSQERSYDPDVFFLTPKGLYVSLMIGY